MKRLAIALIAAVALASCAGTLHTNRSYAPPTASELLQVVRHRQAKVRTMNAETRATSWLGGERVRGTVQMLVERGGQLRFEAEVALQGTVALLIVDRGQFAFIDRQKHVFRRGVACPSNVAELVRIPLAPAEVAAIVLGDALLPDGMATVEWDSGSGADVLVLEARDGTRLRLGLRRPNPRLAAWDVVFLEGHAGQAQGPWRVSYDDFDRSAGVALPRLIRFAEPGKKFDDGVEIKIRDRTINQTFPTGAFSLDPPAGYPIVEAPCR